MIVNPDHMSQAGGRRHAHAARGAPLLRRDLARTAGWTRATGRGSGSSAAWRSPATRTPTSYVKDWQQVPAASRRRTTFGWGYGADLGGLSAPARRRTPTAQHHATRSRAYDGKVTFERQRTGDRTFDYDEGGRRPLRPLRRLVRRPRSASAATQLAARHVERRRGLPRDVGARRRHPRRRAARAPHGASTRAALGALRLGDDWDDAAAQRRPAAAARRAPGAGACSGARQPTAPPTSPC